MRVYAVSNALNTSCAVQKTRVNNNYNTNKTDSFEKSVRDIPQINFGAYRIHIVDGGAHANVMEHFARGIVKNVDDVVDVIMHKADTNPVYSGVKQMKSVKEKLTLLNEENIAKTGDYVAVPCSAQVQLNQLAELMGLESKTITPQNVKSYKSKILGFLNNLDGWRKNSMDPNSQGMEHVFGVIEQINALIKKGVNVYLPAGHPIEGAIKAVAEREGKKDDLYRFIYTRGAEGADTVNAIKNELRAENAYRFNLLALSDAHVVNVRDLSGRNDYVFAAYDSCVNDGARGVFNFYPVRNKDGEILGYSFTDKRTVHYPIGEYLANDEFANIAKFVGKRISTCSANGTYTHMMKNMIAWDEPHPSFPDVLYRVPNIYSPRRLKAEKLAEKGEWVDKSEQLFFDVNDHGEVVFSKCDCEGSGRPSVIPMWGSCFATLNAIRRDIAAAVKAKIGPYHVGHWWNIRESFDPAYIALKDEKLKTAEFLFTKSIKTAKPFEDHPEARSYSLMAYEHLFNLLMKQRKFFAAEGVANGWINLQCKDLLADFRASVLINRPYDMHLARYWDAPETEIANFEKKLKLLASTFHEVANLCHKKGNESAAEISDWAASMIRRKAHAPADAILSRRASGSINIKDIYDEHHDY